MEGGGARLGTTVGEEGERERETGEERERETGRRTDRQTGENEGWRGGGYERDKEKG